MIQITPNKKQISYVLWSNDRLRFSRYIWRIVDRMKFYKERPDATDDEFNKFINIRLYEELTDIRKTGICLNNDIICIAIKENTSTNAISFYKGNSDNNLFQFIKPVIGNDVDKYNETRTITWGVSRYKNLIGLIQDNGTEYFLIYRMFKSGLAKNQKEHFKELCNTGELSEKDINCYTESIGKYVCD